MQLQIEAAKENIENFSSSSSKDQEHLSEKIGLTEQRNSAVEKFNFSKSLLKQK